MQGVVMDIKDGRAVVFRKDGSITEVKDKGYQIGQKVNIAPRYYRQLLTAAACFVLVFIAGTSGYMVYHTPESYVYVDINPSMRLEMNCFDRVISVVPLNEDAAGLMEAYTLASADMEECIDEIISACRENEYLNDQNNDIEFNVVTEKTKVSDRVNAVSEKLKNAHWRVSVRNVDREENDIAMEYRTSPKRLKAVEAFTETFGGTLEENFVGLRGITSEEIYAELEVAGHWTDTDGGTKYKSSPERLQAVKEYSEAFGGSLEENMAALRGSSTREIYDAIEARTPIETI